MIEFVLWKIWDILFSILEKYFWSKFSRKIKISPKKINFSNSERNHEKSFCVYNKTSEFLYDVYLLILDQNWDLSNVKITYKNHNEKNNIPVWDFEINRDIFQAIWSWEDKYKRILSIYKIEPNWYAEIFVESKDNHNIKIKILQYSKEAKWITHKDWKVAFPFEIPKNTTKNKWFSMNGITMCIKKK